MCKLCHVMHLDLYASNWKDLSILVRRMISEVSYGKTFDSSDSFDTSKTQPLGKKETDGRYKFWLDISWINKLYYC